MYKQHIHMYTCKRTCTCMHMNAHRRYTTACNHYHNRQPAHTFTVYMCKFSVHCYWFSHIYVGQSISMAIYIVMHLL